MQQSSNHITYECINGSLESEYERRGGRLCGIVRLVLGFSNTLGDRHMHKTGVGVVLFNILCPLRKIAVEQSLVPNKSS